MKKYDCDVLVCGGFGGIMPLGGSTEQLGSHKGYGYGMLCEIFSSILSMGATSNYCMTGGKGKICHGFAAINPAFFGDPAAIEAHFSAFLQELRELSPRPTVRRASTPTVRRKWPPSSKSWETACPSTTTPWSRCWICAII